MEVTEGSDGKILLRMQYKREDELVYRHIKFQEPVQHGGLPRDHREATPGKTLEGRAVICNTKFRSC